MPPKFLSGVDVTMSFSCMFYKYNIVKGIIVMLVYNTQGLLSTNLQIYDIMIVFKRFNCYNE